MYRPRKAKFHPTALWRDLEPVKWILQSLGEGVWMQPASWLVSRDLTNAAGPWDERLSLDDDGEYFCRVVLASERVRFVPESRVFYRRTPSSLSSIGFSSKKLDSLVLSLQLQIGHLLAVENGEEARAAALRCLQNYLPWFYPERPDLVSALHELASRLGGRLPPPRLGAKYQWIQKTFGWNAAKRTQFFCRNIRGSLNRAWDRILFHFEKEKPASYA